MKKAREIAAYEVNGAGFKRSAGWLWHQKKRFHVGIRHSRNESQKLWEDYHDQWLAFRRFIIHLHKRDDYTLHNIANMDQTMVQFDCTPNLTDTIRGKRTMPIASAGAKKKGCTVALCAHADGSKLPVLIFLKERNGQLGPRVLHQLTIPANVCITATQNGWMTKDKVRKWFRKVWWQSEDGVRQLLILDRYRPYMCNTVKVIADELFNDLVLSLVGCTSIAQPLEVFRKQAL